MKPVQLQGYSHQGRETLLAALIAEVDQNDACLLGQKDVSHTTVELRLEIGRRSVADFYAGVVSTGLELTRPTHLAMAGLCTCSQGSFGSSEGLTDGVAVLNLKVCFLEGLTVESFLLCSSSPA